MLARRCASPKLADRVCYARVGGQVGRRLAAADGREGGASGRAQLDDGGLNLATDATCHRGDPPSGKRVADRDDLPDDRAGFDLEGARHLQWSAECLVGRVREGALVLRLEDIAFEADDGLVRAPGVMADGDHVAEGHVLRDEVRESGLQCPEERLHGGRLASQARRVQDAEPDARRHEGRPAEAVEHEADRAVAGPADGPLPGHVDAAGLPHAFRAEADLEGVSADVALVGGEDGLDGGPAGVAHGRVDPPHRLHAGRRDPAHRAVDDGEGGAARRDVDGRLGIQRSMGGHLDLQVGYRSTSP